MGSFLAQDGVSEYPGSPRRGSAERPGRSRAAGTASIKWTAAEWIGAEVRGWSGGGGPLPSWDNVGFWAPRNPDQARIALVHNNRLTTFFSDCLVQYGVGVFYTDYFGHTTRSLRENRYVVHT